MLHLFTTTPDHRHDQLTGIDYDDLRDQLVKSDEIENVDLYSNWADQVQAVYPFVLSELDEGEALPVPRPVTIELLRALAGSVWDCHAKHVVVSEVPANERQCVFCGDPAARVNPAGKRCCVDCYWLSCRR